MRKIKKLLQAGSEIKGKPLILLLLDSVKAAKQPVPPAHCHSSSGHFSAPMMPGSRLAK